MVAVRNLAAQRYADRVLAQYGGHGYPLGDAFPGAPEDRFSLSMRVLEQLRNW